MKPRWWWLLLIAVLWGNALAGERIVDNVVRVHLAQTDGRMTENTYGSGAYMGNRVVLSCAHLFDDGPSLVGRVYFRDGEQHEFVCRSLDRQWDQSVLHLKSQPTRQGLKLAQAVPQIGDPVFAYGYGRGNRVMVTSGRVHGYRSYSASVPNKDWIVMTGRVDKGSSGGPILNEQGYVVGNLWGTKPVDSGTWHTVGIMTGRTRRFLLPWNAKLQAVGIRNGLYPPRSRVACPPGGS